MGISEQLICWHPLWISMGAIFCVLSLKASWLAVRNAYLNEPKVFVQSLVEFLCVKKITTFQKSLLYSTKDLSQNIIFLRLNYNLPPYHYHHCLWFCTLEEWKKSNIIPFSCDSSSDIWRQQLYSHTVFCRKKNLQFLNECVKLHILILSVCMSSLREATQKWTWKF